MFCIKVYRVLIYDKLEKEGYYLEDVVSSHLINNKKEEDEFKKRLLNFLGFDSDYYLGDINSRFEMVYEYVRDDII